MSDGIENDVYSLSKRTLFDRRRRNPRFDVNLVQGAPSVSSWTSEGTLTESIHFAEK